MIPLLLLFLLTACFDNTVTVPQAPDPTTTTSTTSTTTTSTTTTTLAPPSVGICWDPNPEPNIAGYTVYVSEHPQARQTFLKKVETVENFTRVYDLDPDKPAHMQVTAHDTDGLESDPSEEITFFQPRLMNQRVERQNNTIVFTFLFYRPLNKANQEFVVESSTDLNNPIWFEETAEQRVLLITEENMELIDFAVPAVGPMKFFRVSIRYRPDGCAAK